MPLIKLTDEQKETRERCRAAAKTVAPLHGFVLIFRDPAKEKIGRIWIPPSAAAQQARMLPVHMGEILQVGAGRKVPCDKCKGDGFAREKVDGHVRRERSRCATCEGVGFHRQHPKVAPGDVVLFTSTTGDEIEVGGEILLFAREFLLLAVVDELDEAS